MHPIQHIETGKKGDTSEYIKEWYKGSVSLQYLKGILAHPVISFLALQPLSKPNPLKTNNLLRFNCFTLKTFFQS